MIKRPHAATLTMVITFAVVILCGGKVIAGIGGQESRHNMTDIPGYGFTMDVCAACHKPHYSIEKRLWTSDKEKPADGLRNLGPAKAASLDQGLAEPEKALAILSKTGALKPRRVLYLTTMSLRILFSALPMCTSPFANGGPSCKTNFSAPSRCSWIFS